jgi:hypothetical protein
MMQTVQISLGDAGYASTIQEALCRSCACHVETVDLPDPARCGVLVVDEQTFSRLPLPLPNPERVVLITHCQPEFFEQAWDAGLVRVLSRQDPLDTILLAIMAANLRVARADIRRGISGKSPMRGRGGASVSPIGSGSNKKRCKTP